MLYDFLPELCNSEFKLNIESMCDDDIGENFCIIIGIAGKYNAQRIQYTMHLKNLKKFRMIEGL